MTQKQLTITTIQFPEIRLETRDAHKLRGYFGNLFQQHSPVLHNHYQNGEFRHQYPEVQYKVINNTPLLVGLKEGAELLPKLFLDIKKIQIEYREYLIQTKNIERKQVTIGFSNQLHRYRFQTLWMALNQHNYRQYIQMQTEQKKNERLNSILVGHLLSFFRNTGVELSENEKLMANVDVLEKTTRFKNNKMIAFSGSFVTNALLPNSIGLGKSVSRGFGTIHN